MSCYLRHMRELFEALDLEYDKPNRKRVDAAIRVIVGAKPEDHCPEVWASIKAMPEVERQGLTGRVAELLGEGRD